MSPEDKVRVALKILNEVDLPVIPSEIIWLEEALKDESFSFHDIIKRLENNTRLVEEIIKTANEVLLKIGDQVTTISQAVNFLGAQSLYHLVVSSRFKQSFENNPSYHVVLEHSIWVAKAMTLLERRTGGDEPDFAYTLGLFHNIGGLALSLKDPDKYQLLFQTSRSFPITALEKEEVRYETNHCLMGAVVGKKWKLKKVMIECIYRHHVANLQKLGSAEITKWVALLRLANSLVDQVCYEIYRTQEMQKVEAEALEYLSIPPQRFENIKHEFVSIFIKNKSLHKI